MQYLARFKDDKGMPHVRKYFASHDVMAHRKAGGIAKSNKWQVVSVGSV